MMERIAIICNVLLFLVALCITSTKAQAEWVGELYSGVGYTQNHNAHVNLPDAGITAVHESLKFDSATLLGGRGGYWIDQFPYLGFGIDISHYFGADQKQQVSITNLCVEGIGCSSSPEALKKINSQITAVGFDIMLRYPLIVTAQFTKGQLQPYLTVGPAAFITTLKDTDNFNPPGQSSSYTSLGIKSAAGLMLFFTKNIGVFIEYRDTKFKVKDQYNNATVVNGLTLGKTLGSATFNIQGVIGGITYDF